MIQKVANVSIWITDYDAAIAFYTEKVGLELRMDNGFGDGYRWVAVAPPGVETEIILYIPDDNWQHYKPIIGQTQALTLQVDDMHKTVTEMKDRGVEFAEDPFDTPWGIFATFLDQDKNRVMLVQPSSHESGE